MAVPVQDPVITHTGNGVTTVFAYDFLLLSQDDLVVYVDDVIQGSGYTISGVGTSSGGEVTFSAAPASGVAIRFERIVALARTTDYQQNGDFLSRVVNPDFDRIWMALQRVNYIIGSAVGSASRVLRLGNGDTNGAGAYLAQQNRIQDLADPINLQDGANKRWVQGEVGKVLTDGAGNYVLNLLSAYSGASLIGFDKSGTPQTVQQHLDMLYYGVANIRDTRFSGGAKGTWDGAAGADDTAAVQAAIDSGARFINVPPLAQGYSYQLTAPIVITTPVSFVGAGVEIFRYAQGSRGAGSWFHINHTGVGFNFSDTSGTAARTGGRIEKIGTWRTQPTPGAGWSPTAHDWDIAVSNYDVILRDVVLFNPTKAVFHDKGNAGRLTIDGLYGQPLTSGIECSETYDVCRLNNIHFWPYWSDQADVRAWTLTHRRDISLKRCDNPLLSNIFTIFGQYPLVLTPSAAGTPSKVHLSNVDFDGFGGCGILFEAGANATTLQGANVTMQGQTGYVTTGVQFNADNCIVTFANLSINNVWRHAVELIGANNIVTLGGFEARDWNLSNTSLTAVACAASNTVRVPSKPYFNDTFGANYYSGPGTIEAALSDGVVGETTDASGEVTVTHNSRAIPKKIYVQCTGGAAGMTAQVRAGTFTNTTFKVLFMQPGGAVLASTPITFYWKAEL